MSRVRPLPLVLGRVVNALAAAAAPSGARSLLLALAGLAASESRRAEMRDA